MESWGRKCFGELDNPPDRKEAFKEVRRRKPPEVIPGQAVKKLVKLEYRKTACTKWRSFRGRLNEVGNFSSGYRERSKLFSFKKVLEVLVHICDAVFMNVESECNVETLGKSFEYVIGEVQEFIEKSKLPEVA
jgi:hypothetical protein